MKYGSLDFLPATENLTLVAKPVQTALQANNFTEVGVASIDPTLADTAAFCKAYNIGLEVSANCVIVEAKRADKVWYAACMILATDRIDINNTVRRRLDARKISFAPMETAVSLTGMEYGGITPIGLPADWPILVDTKVAQCPQAVIGSGLRSSKILVPGTLIAQLPSAVIMDLTKEVA